MDIQQLCQLLTHCTSYDAGQRKAAEAALEQATHVHGHLVNLLRISMEDSIAGEVRQVAAIRFKNLVRRQWDDPDKPHQLLEDDMVFIRANLVESVIRIVYSDFPESWPSLMDQIYANLNTQDQQRILGALGLLRTVVRKFEFKDESQRAPLETIVQGTFPLLLQIMQALLAVERPGIEVAEAQKLVCKTFWSCTYMQIPSILIGNEQQFTGWMSVIHTMVMQPVPMDGQPEDEEERARWTWWKVKKWALHISNRLFQRYGDPKGCRNNPTDKSFAKLWAEQCSGPFLEAHMTLLQRKAQGGWLSPRVTNSTVQYLTHAVQLSRTYKMIKPHLQGLLVNAIFPLCCFDDTDQTMWEEDPHEYIRKGYDILEDMYSPKTAAMNFIHEMSRVRSAGNLEPFMAHLVTVLNQHAAAGVSTAPKHIARNMDGALLAIGALQTVLVKKDPYKSQLEALLTAHVVPLFESPWGHLRAKACWIAGQFSDIHFAEGQGKGPVFSTLLTKVVARLTDPELPVRVDACVALRAFLEPFEADDLTMLRPLLPAILRDFFALMGEVENEEMITTLEALIETFSDDMAQYAVQLAQHLAQAFWRIQQQEEENDDDDDDTAALAAYGCVRTIGTLLEAVSTLPHLYTQLEDILFPIMDRYLSQEGESIFEEVVQMLSYFTFLSPELSPRLWTLWPKLHEAVTTWAIDYFDEVLVCLDNYISRGTDVFLGSATYLQSANQIVETVLRNEDFPEDDITGGPQLISIVLQNCRGRVDACLAPYLQLVLARLHGAHNVFFRDQLVCVVANALHYNAVATMAELQRVGALVPFFSGWYAMVMASMKSGKPRHFRRMYDKKVCILGLSSLLGLPDASVPQELAPAWPQVLQMLVRLMVTLREKQNEAENAPQEEEEEEEEDEDDEVTRDLGDDEDELDEDETELLRRLAASRGGGEEDSDDDYWTEEEEAQTPIDPIDPYVFFADAMQACPPGRASVLTAGMDGAVQGTLQELLTFAATQRAQQTSSSS